MKIQGRYFLLTPIFIYAIYYVIINWLILLYNNMSESDLWISFIIYTILGSIVLMLVEEYLSAQAFKVMKCIMFPYLLLYHITRYIYIVVFDYILPWFDKHLTFKI